MSNNHMTHLEDLLVTEGVAGARRALKYCGDLLEMLDDSESHLWDLYNLTQVGRGTCDHLWARSQDGSVLHRDEAQGLGQ
jgi:hypothetical protein